MKRPKKTTVDIATVMQEQNRQDALVTDLADLVHVAHKRIDSLLAPVDKSKEVAALVGLWIDRQKASGQTTVDLKRVDDIRTGIELALT